MNKTSSGSLWAIGIAILIIVLLVWSYKTSHKPATTVANPTELVGLQATTTLPWPPEIDHLRERLTAIGLPALSSEGTALHIHQHLDIFIHGNSVAVPPSIGISGFAGFISQLHVHDSTSVIHVESPTIQTFTLGQFFDVWGVKFTADCIGGYCADATSTLKMYVNGDLYSGDPRLLALSAHQEIVVVYGTPEETPKTIPSAYVFPDGE
jgi:hypothetical protein